MSAPPASGTAGRRRPWVGLAAILLLALLAYAADGWTKAWAEQGLVIYRPVSVIGDIFRLTLGYNTGVAFGLFAGGGVVILALSGAIILGVAAWVAVALRAGDLPARLWPLGLILGGALANLADRVPDGRVTDFLDVGIGTARWPTFNLADTFIVVGIGLLLVSNYFMHPANPDDAPVSVYDARSPAPASAPTNGQQTIAVSGEQALPWR